MVQQVYQLVRRQLTTDSFAVDPCVPSLAVVICADRRPVHRGRRPHGAGNPRGLNVLHLQHIVRPSVLQCRLRLRLAYVPLPSTAFPSLQPLSFWPILEQLGT